MPDCGRGVAYCVDYPPIYDAALAKTVFSPPGDFRRGICEGERFFAGDEWGIGEAKSCELRSYTGNRYDSARGEIPVQSVFRPEALP
jgi:hypothetical protein